MCLKVLANHLTTDLDYWKVYQNLPPDIINGILLLLPPLTLQALSNELLLKSREQNGEGRSDLGANEEPRKKKKKKKRSHNDSPRPLDCSALNLGMSAAWKAHYDKRWPASNPETVLPRLSNGDDSSQEEPDWQQLYWEAHLQWCLNAASETLSIMNLNSEIGAFVLPSEQLKTLRDETTRIEETSLATLRANCVNFGRFARKLRLHSILCTPELVVLLKHAQLQSITFINIRIKSELTGICQLLSNSLDTLRSVELFHSRLTGETLNRIGRAMCPSGVRHHIQHFALIHTRIFDQAELFALSSDTDFLRFLCAGSSLRSFKLCDNYLDQENLVFIMKVVLQFVNTIGLLQISDNELGEVFARLFSSYMKTPNPATSESLPVFKRLSALDLRGNLLDSGAIDKMGQCLCQMPLLQQLDVSENPLKDAGISNLVSYITTTCTALKELTLATIDMTATGAISLFDALANSNTTIRRLSIANNRLGSTVVPSLVNFLSKSSLESLDISDIDLGCSGCTNNGLEDALIASKTLHHFNFSNNRIGPIGANMVANIIASGRSSLLTIDVSGNVLSTDSVIGITRAIRESKVHGHASGRGITLDLRKNPGSFLVKILGQSSTVGACTLLLSDTTNMETLNILHDDDP
jgi:Ran GTPase-activating protein (RanGAP) involved in mRNA processing and transport